MHSGIFICKYSVETFYTMQDTKQFSFAYIFNIVVNALLCFTAIALNSVTIRAIGNTSSLPKPLRTLLLNLAVSDLWVGLLVHPLYIALLVMLLNQNNENQIAVINTRRALIRIARLLYLASFFGVMALTADRFLAIHLHLRYQELVTHKRVVVLVVTMTVFSAFLSSMDWWIQDTSYTYITVITIKIMCLVIPAILYCNIYLTVRRHRNQIESLQVGQGEQNGEMTAPTVARFLKLALGTFYVYLVFLLCYLPLTCIQIVLAARGQNTTTNHLSYYFWTMVLLNSSLNPVIYCWKMRHIRHAMKNAVKDISSCGI